MTVTAALFTTVAAPQVITRRQYHQPVIQIVVLAFNERNHSVCAAVPHLLKDKRRASTTGASRCAKAALEVFAVEEIVDVTEEAQRARFAMKRQRVACAYIGLGYSPKTISTTGKRYWVKNRREIVTRRREVKVHQEAATKALRGNQ